jgi:hypothetical protein
MLIKQGTHVAFRPGVPISETLEEIDMIYSKIKAIGPIEPDQLKSVFILKALGKHYDQLQSQIMSLTNVPNFTSDILVNRMLQEEMFIRGREDAGHSNPTALITQSKPRNRPSIIWSSLQMLFVFLWVNYCAPSSTEPHEALREYLHAICVLYIHGP